MNHIIGISGKRGVGKTTAAKYLERFYRFEVVSFASLLRDQAAQLFPFKELHLKGGLKEKPFEDYDWAPRDFLIKFGQFMRYWDENYWVNAALKKIEGKDRVVFDDLRYTNEANILKRNGAKLIRIERYKKENPCKPNPFYDNDPSETQLDDYKHFDAKIEKFHNVKLFDLHKELDVKMKILGFDPDGN